MHVLLEPIVKSHQLPHLVKELRHIWRNEQVRRRRFREELDEDMKAEFVDGEVILHSFARLAHLRVRENINAILRFHVLGRNLGEVHGEKALCAFSRNDYEPDIVFFSNAKIAPLPPDHKVLPRPDLIVEILSPSTAALDRGRKFQDYESEGVAEYWIVDADAGTVEQYVGEGAVFALRFSGGRGELASVAIAGLTVDVAAFFDTKAHLAAIHLAAKNLPSP